MICPYTIGKQKTVTQFEKSGDDPDGESSQTVEIVSYELPNCPQNECGAWRDGHCGYRGAVD